MRREVAAQIEQLRRSSEQLGSVLGSMIEGVLAVDDRERILFANRAARTLLEFATPDAVGRPLLEAVRNRAVVDVVRQAFRTQEPAKSEFPLPGATRRVVAVSASRLPGNPYPGVLLVLHDVSDLRRLETLRQEFVANVSHELKTPLTAIKAYAETLLEGALGDREHNEAFVRRIAEQAERLHQLIMDLLSIARIESGEEPFEIAAVDIGELVQSCVANHTNAAESRRIHLSVSPSEAPVRARADEEGLRQILDNLIDNAIKYTPEGGRVTVRWSAAESLARIQVEDTGIGIAPEDQARIFERFYRVDKARSRELGGTGLGLSIVKHLSQSFGGGVSVRSEVGRGSTFSVWLPLA
jgi:two-component system phosphate regulon sensor histidine kinase PhoR